MANIVLGIFSEKDKAEEAITKLESTGYNPKDMSIVMKDTKEAKEMSENTGADDVMKGVTAGAGTGAVVGGIAGFLAGTVLPGLGGFLIGGPIGAALGLTGAAATTISGVATGTVAGGLLGALTSTFGLSDEEAKTYESKIQEGGILVAVPARSGDEQEVSSIMSQYGADNIKLIEHSGQEKGEKSQASQSNQQQPTYFNEIGRRGGKVGSNG